MSLTDKEKKILKQISVNKQMENSRKDYLNFGWHESSYYGVPEDTFYLEEYQFETPLELKAMLEEFFAKVQLPEELALIVTAAVFKLKGQVKDEGKIMETIYNF